MLLAYSIEVVSNLFVSEFESKTKKKTALVSSIAISTVVSISDSGNISY